MKQTRNSIALFLLITMLLSALTLYPIIAREFPVTWFWMWSPGVAAILVARIYRSQAISLGVRTFRGKESLLGILIPLLYLGISYAFYWLLSGSFAPGDNAFFAAPGLMALAIPINVMAALGEEIGWRGFLAPGLNGWLGFGKASILSGVVWAAWHFPLIISQNSLVEEPLLPRLLLFTVQITAMGAIMLRLRLSGSVWPATFFHASHNICDQVFLGPSTSGASTFLVGETGVLTLVATIACLFPILRGHRQKHRVTG